MAIINEETPNKCFYLQGQRKQAKKKSNNCKMKKMKLKKQTQKF